jgi:pilus assembly protein Flp/PilA
MSTAKIVPERIMPGRLSAAMRFFMSDCSGAAAIEYAIVAGIIGIAVAAAVTGLSGAVSDLYQRVINAFGS